MGEANQRAAAAAGWWQLFHRRLAVDQQVALPMLSGSMAPDMPVGATLHIAGVTADVCRPGDVVVFRQDDKLVAHRLLAGLPAGGNGGFLQAGDVPARLGWVSAARIAGLVIAITGPDGGTRDLRTPAGRREAERLARRGLARALRKPLEWLRGKAMPWR